ncbi:PEP-CTERM protein-sorting domain-containing protein [Duganella sp. CF402]|nr:putative secreted protein with PEP-CTERM sorting signal [Duganella sp. BK701]SEL45902.1 PEP-CTERM protein-sorting domain-containing protein [Duganella sp. CF402]
MTPPSSPLPSSYKGSAAALLALSAAHASANVVVVPAQTFIDVPTPVAGQDSSYSLTFDVDHNGTVDLTYSREIFYVGMTQPPSSGIAPQPMYNTFSYLSAGLGVADPLAPGTLIGPSLAWTPTSQLGHTVDDQHYSSVLSNAPGCKNACTTMVGGRITLSYQDSVTKNPLYEGISQYNYIPFSFFDGEHTDYGWVKVTGYLGNQVILIDTIAYDDSGAFIHAGEFTSTVPEPSSLAMLATGLAGLAVYRRAAPAARRRKPKTPD